MAWPPLHLTQILSELSNSIVAYLCHPPPTTVGVERRMFSGRPAGRPLIPIPRDAISLYLMEGFHTSDRHVGGYCRTGRQGQRSKVKVIARPNALLRRRRTCFSS